MEKENPMGQLPQDDTIDMRDAEDGSTTILTHAEEELLKAQSAAFIKKSFLQWNGLDE